MWLIPLQHRFREWLPYTSLAIEQNIDAAAVPYFLVHVITTLVCTGFFVYPHQATETRTGYLIHRLAFNLATIGISCCLPQPASFSSTLSNSFEDWRRIRGARESDGVKSPMLLLPEICHRRNGMQVYWLEIRLNAKQDGTSPKSQAEYASKWQAEGD